MNASVVIALTAAWLSQAAATKSPPSQADELLVTEKRSEYFKETLSELDKTAEWLDRLGDPRKKETGESTDDYFDRVKSIYQHRARLLILLQWEYEEALEIRYELEADLKEYTGQLLEEDDKSKQRHAQLLKRKEELRRKRADARDELAVVGFLLRDALKKEERALEKKPEKTRRDKDHLADLQKQIKELEAARKEAPSVANRQGREAKYENYTTEQLQTAVRAAISQVKDADFESRYLENHVLNETPQVFENLLGERYYRILQDANKLVTQTRVMEDRAAQVAILARYVREDLRSIDTAVGLIELRRRLQEILAAEGERREYVEKIAGDQLGSRSDDGEVGEYERVLTGVAPRQASGESEKESSE